MSMANSMAAAGPNATNHHITSKNFAALLNANSNDSFGVSDGGGMVGFGDNKSFGKLNRKNHFKWKNNFFKSFSLE